jgi:hypothetical protein
VVCQQVSRSEAKPSEDQEAGEGAMRDRSRAPVVVPADLSERLGFGDQPTSVRALASGPRTVLLERLDGEGGAVPWDRDLVLCADVRAFSLADVMQLVHASSKSGFLMFEHADCAKCVYLHAGEVVFASSNQKIDRLGASLLRAGVISRDEFHAATAAYRGPGQYGRFLVERGVLSPRELWDGVKRQVEEIVRSLFAFGTGQVLFWEGEVRPDNVVRLALPTGRLIEEGLEHRDELLAFLAQLEDNRVRLAAAPGALAPLDGTARAIVAALGSVGTTFASVCQSVGIDPLSGARTVAMLDQMGALRIIRAGVGSSAPGADDALRECVRTHVRLLAELTAPVVAMEGAEPVRLRLCEVARGAAERHPQLLAGLEFGPGGALDPEVLIERALCFPGDREREVRAALGELVSYTEFELLNHPKVKNAEEFLEALEERRAKL